MKKWDFAIGPKTSKDLFEKKKYFNKSSLNLLSLAKKAPESTSSILIEPSIDLLILCISNNEDGGNSVVITRFLMLSLFTH